MMISRSNWSRDGAEGGGPGAHRRVRSGATRPPAGRVQPPRTARCPSSRARSRASGSRPTRSPDHARSTSSRPSATTTDSLDSPVATASRRALPAARSAGGVAPPSSARNSSWAINHSIEDVYAFVTSGWQACVDRLHADGWDLDSCNTRSVVDGVFALENGSSRSVVVPLLSPWRCWQCSGSPTRQRFRGASAAADITSGATAQHRHTGGVPTMLTGITRCA